MKQQRLVVMDDNEQRVKVVEGFNWIFEVVAKNPEDISDFIIKEEQLATCVTKNYLYPHVSAMKQSLNFEDLNTLKRIIDKEYNLTIGDLRTLSKGNLLNSISDINDKWSNKTELETVLDHVCEIIPIRSKETSKRSKYEGGTIIVDTRKKEVIVKGHTSHEFREYHHTIQKKTEKGIIHPKTGEFWYDVYGLISKLRRSSVEHSRSKNIEYYCQRFGEKRGDLILTINSSKNPTADNPNNYISRSDFFGERIAIEKWEWKSSYRVPNSWKIIDGIRRKTY